MTSRCQRWYIKQAGWWNPLSYKFGKRNSQYVKPKSYPNQSHFLLMSLALSEVGRSASQNNSNPGYSDSNGPPTPPPTYSYIERQTSYVSDISQRSSQSKYTFGAWFCADDTFSVNFFFFVLKIFLSLRVISFYRIDGTEVTDFLFTGRYLQAKSSVFLEIVFQYRYLRTMTRRWRCLIRRVEGVGLGGDPASLAPAPAAPAGGTGRGFPSSDLSRLRRQGGNIFVII